MTLGKGFALVLAFVGAVALGVWIGPRITHSDSTMPDPAASAVQAPEAGAETDQTRQDAKRAPASQRAAMKPVATTGTMTPVAPGTTQRTVPVISPALHAVLKPLLNNGADMATASEGFVDAEQYATVAHAARNTEVPFMVLKHRVVDEGKSLENAIHELNPRVNAAVEANRARAEAKSDIVALKE